MNRALPRLFAVCVLALALIASFAASAMAQEGTGGIRGKIIDAQTNQPLPGANVIVRGTTYGAAANLDGEYLIRALAPGKYSVQARYIGYQSATEEVTVVAGQTARVDFALATTAIQIDEVIVTGMAVAAERRTLGNTISTISTRELGRVPVTSLSEVLQGRAPGVVTLVSSGQAGAGSSLRIRGMTSVTQSNEPVVYIDGVRVDNSNSETFYTTGGQRPSRLNDISPSDIERVEIIKGASATTLYGTQASAGVIQIFTKRGAAGAPQVNFQHQVGWISVPKIDVGQVKVTQSLLDSLRRKNVDLSLFPNLTIGNDAVNSVRRTGPFEAYEASVRGGIESARYYVSGRYENELGAQPSNQVRRYNFKGNVDADVTNNFKLSFTSGYVNYYLRRPNNDNNIFGLIGNAFLSNLYNARAGRPWGEPFTALNLAQKIESDQRVDRFTGALTADYRPFGLWTHKITIGTDVVAEENTQFFAYGEGYSLYPDGYKINNRRTNTRITLDYATSYKETFLEDFSGSITGGAQLFFDSEFTASATGEKFPAPGVSTVSAAATRLGFETRVLSRNGGFFAQGQVGWKERVFLTLGARLDKSSTFGKQFEAQFYPKAGFSYLISEEPFWPLFPYWNSLKLRAAYGKSGQQPSIYAAERTWSSVAALNGVPAVTPNNLGDPDLKPEISQEIEFGLDAGFLDSRIGIEATYYDQTTNDALISVPSIPSRGFINPQLRNVGEVKNRGYEIGLRTIPYRSEDIDVSLNATLSGVKNEVTDMGKSADIPFGLGSIGKIKKGYPISSFFGQRVIDVRTYDTYDPVATRFGEPVLSSEEYLGQTMPKMWGSVSASVTLFRQLSISASADWATGHVIFNGTKQFTAQASYNSYEPVRVLREKLNNPAVVGQERREAQREFQMLNTLYRAQFVEKGDFLKIRELTVTYMVPTEWLGSFSVRSLSLTFATRNLATFTDYTGADPEVNFAGQQEINRGQDFLTFPQTQRFIFTLNVGL